MSVLTISSTTALESAPRMIPEQQITLFKFYMDQSMQDGVTYGKELYQLARQFVASDRLEAYRYGCELLGQGVPTLISVSKQRYIVWTGLRRPLAVPQ
ncbi:hypothetical protein JOY44_27600 (plasmid) [Phormidium sp. CLA17]|uniref:hypothetical protein n=1 Tax=Leptolyngbya sp. Cla-17 TaxID=2803751 RepID=UPI001492537F|nr:hypothetical protein [Leptolyngbya sp. Cla-17]MBM0745241.1 hypothetical protein [Leptolyngbya sp. Cla-17]